MINSRRLLRLREHLQLILPKQNRFEIDYYQKLVVLLPGNKTIENNRNSAMCLHFKACWCNAHVNTNITNVRMSRDNLATKGKTKS